MRTEESDCLKMWHYLLCVQKCGLQEMLAGGAFLLCSGLCLGQVVQAQLGESFPWNPLDLGACTRARRVGGGEHPGGGLFGNSASLPGTLPKPSLQALPSSLAPLKTQVTIRCQGPPDVDLYRLEKLRSRKYQDRPVLFIKTMEESFAGCYRCSYQNGTLWSPPSNQLELVATGTWKGMGGGHLWPQGSRRVKRGMMMTANPESWEAGVRVGSYV